MSFRRISIILIIAAMILTWADISQAGFGISPPRIWNDYLTPGSHFEQTITLSRSEPKEPVEITVEIDAPEIKDWIKIDKGEKFIYPAGPQQFPMTVIVDVPEDAGYSTYYGKMTIKAAPVGVKGQVIVALGALVDIKLRVSGEEFSDFKIRNIGIPDFEEGWPLKFFIELENLGNVKVRPSKVHLDIFDNFHQQKLKSGDIIQMNWVEAFRVGESEGELAVDLKSGQYWADFEIYKNENLVLRDKIRFNVHFEGTLVPKSLFKQAKEFLTASATRLILFTFLGTLILIGLIILGIFSWKRYKKRKLKLEK